MARTPPVERTAGGGFPRVGGGRPFGRPGAQPPARGTPAAAGAPLHGLRRRGGGLVRGVGGLAGFHQPAPPVRLMRANRSVGRRARTVVRIVVGSIKKRLRSRGPESSGARASRWSTLGETR